MLVNLLVHPRIASSTHTRHVLFIFVQDKMILPTSSASLLLLASSAGITYGCSDYFMNFTNPSIRLSGRTMDLGSTTNWTITSWPAGEEYASDFNPESSSEQKYTSFRWTSIYNTIGITGNWFGDDHYGFPSLFGDGINEKGLSCGLLTLIDTVYEDPSPNKKNIFYGTFCQWALQNFANVHEVSDSMDDIRIWGPVILAEHFVLRDANGDSLIIELMDGKKHVYLDENNGKSGWGIMTNEPTFDWHLTNIGHYEWKRSLSRQAVGVPGGWYPEDRFLRLHMVWPLLLLPLISLLHFPFFRLTGQKRHATIRSL
jgi:penicillin V acylase-like amidase (Ntn superfamily)